MHFVSWNVPIRLTLIYEHTSVNPDYLSSPQKIPNLSNLTHKNIVDTSVRTRLDHRTIDERA